MISTSAGLICLLGEPRKYAIDRHHVLLLNAGLAWMQLIVDEREFVPPSLVWIIGRSRIHVFDGAAVLYDTIDLDWKVDAIAA